jgi:TolB-like protein/Flp pilus assembly protein TadD
VTSETGEALGAVIEFAGGVTQALKADPKTGTFQGKVAMGQYLVTIKLDGYLSQEQKIGIEGGKETRVDFKLKVDEKWLAMIKTLLAEANRDFAAGNLESARKKAEKFLALRPKSAEAFLLLGQVNYQGKNLALAKDNLSQSLSLNPGQAPARFYLGMVFLAQRDLEKAAAEFKKAAELDPNHEAAHLQLGMIYQQQNQLSRAEQEFNMVLNANPKNVEAQKYLSEIYFSQGRLALTKEDYLKARDNFIKSLEKNPANDQARYFLAQTFLKIPHFIEAKDLLGQYLSANPNSTEAKEALDQIARAWPGVAAPPVPAAPAPGPAPKTEIKSVAVSSFENRSGDKQNDWLKVGIAEALNTDLSKFSYLRVAERRQVEEILKEKRLKQLGIAGGGDSEPGADLYEEVAKSLSTQAVIFGGYQMVGGNLRIDARLVNVTNGEVINAVSVEGKLADIFDLERKLALGLVRNFIPVTPQELASVQGGETKDLDAFRKYSQGMSLFYLGDSQAAQKMYQEALKTDPRYSDALRELALSRKDISKADTLAIMPFQNATGQAKYDWLKVGIAESLTTDLKKATGIFLVERMKIESALKEMKLAQVLGIEDAAQIGKQVGAGVVLIGSYQMLGDQIRVDSRMVEVESGQILMSEKVIGTVDTIFKVEEDLALKIADTLKVKLSPEEMAQIKQKPDLESFKRYILAHSSLQIREAAPAEKGGKKVEIRTIAVTEFENTSGDQKNAWIGGGIQNALTTDLKRKGNFNLIERSEIGKVVREQEQKLSKIGVTKEDLAAKVGEAVGADAVIAGDFQTVGDTVRINSRLVNVSTGEILLAERVDGKMESIFELQSQLAEKMLKVLQEAGGARTSGGGRGTELARSPYAALGSSLLLPGSAQIFVNKKPIRGLTIFGVEVALGGAALAYHLLYTVNYDKYVKNNDQGQWQKAQDDYQVRNYLLAGVGAVALFSAIDAFIITYRGNRSVPAAGALSEAEPEEKKAAPAQTRKWNVDLGEVKAGMNFKVKYRF